MLKLAADWLLYILFSMAGAAVRRMTVAQTYRVAIRLGSLMYDRLKLRRPLVEKNLRNAFPEKSAAELDRIARGAYHTQAINLLELFRVPLIGSKADARALFEVDASAPEKEAFEKGKGCVLVSAHFGNWELMAICGGMLWRPARIIVKAQSNRFIDKKINEWRTRFGNTIVEMASSPRVVIRDLREGNLVAILSDQAGWDNGSFMEFLGQEAAVFLGAATFALRTRSPVTVAMAVRTGTGTYRMEFTMIETGDLDTSPEHFQKSVETLTARHLRCMEDYIRRYPEQWLWLHDRWKHKRPQPVHNPLPVGAR